MSGPFFKSGGSGNGPSAFKGISIVGPAASAILPVNDNQTGMKLRQVENAITKAVNSDLAASLYQSGQDLKRENTLRGMQAAAMGKSIQDIQAEQPWYSRIFGKNDVVGGAEAYAKATRANETLLSLQRDMDHLKTLDPDDARRVIMDRFKGAETGIPDIDLDIQQQLLAKFPGLIDAQTKENYKYKQEEMSKAQNAFQISATEALTADIKLLDNGPVNADTQAQAAFAVQKWDADTSRLNGQDEDVYIDNLGKALLTEAGRIGEPVWTTNPDGTRTQSFRSAHGLHAIVTHSENFRKLPENMQAQILDRMETNSRKAVAMAAVPYTNEIAKIDALISNPPPYTDVPSMIRRKQEIYNKIERDAGTPFRTYSWKEQAGDATRMGNAIAHREEQERARRIADQQRAAAEAAARGNDALQQQVWLQMAMMDPNGLKANHTLGGMTNKQYEQTLNQGYMMLQGRPQDQYAFMASQHEIPKVAKDQREAWFLALVNQDPKDLLGDTAKVTGAVNQFQQDLEALGAVRTRELWGADRYKAISEAARLQKQDSPPEVVAAAIHRKYQERDWPTSGATHKEAVQKAIKSQTGFWSSISAIWDSGQSTRALFGSDLDKKFQQAITGDAAAVVARILKDDPTISESQAAEQALREVTGPDGRWQLLPGGFAVQNLVPGQESLVSQFVNPKNGLGIPQDKLGDFLLDTMDEYIKGNVSEVVPIFNGRRNTIVFQTRDEYGNTTNHPVQIDELIEKFNKSPAGDRVRFKRQQTNAALGRLNRF